MNEKNVRVASEQTIRDHFVDEHRTFEVLFAELLQALSSVEQVRVAALWSAFESGVCSHLEAEESFLIPPLLAERPREAGALLAEHRHIRTRLGALTKALESRSFGEGSVRGFIDELRAHVRHEEAVLYIWADERLAQADREALWEKLADSRRERARGTQPSR